MISRTSDWLDFCLVKFSLNSNYFIFFSVFNLLLLFYISYLLYFRTPYLRYKFFSLVFSLVFFVYWCTLLSALLLLILNMHMHFIALRIRPIFPFYFIFESFNPSWTKSFRRALPAPLTQHIRLVFIVIWKHEM